MDHIVINFIIGAPLSIALFQVSSKTKNETSYTNTNTNKINTRIFEDEVPSIKKNYPEGKKSHIRALHE